jgi:porphobilinogen synthase
MEPHLDIRALAQRRPRRLRRTEAIRRLVGETTLRPDQLVLPLFIMDGSRQDVPIEAMPGVSRLSIDLAVARCERAMSLGVLAFALFPVIEAGLKSPAGEEGLNEDNLLCRAVRTIKRALPDCCLVTDVALDPYSSLGHDGLVGADGTVLNDETVEILAQMAVLHAAAGADVVAPSDMMDGRVGAIRGALDAAGWQDTIILSYTAKYASAFYGPFRQALDSAPADAPGVPRDKKTYQMDPANSREALVETRLDAAEGADIVMVKPALPYLDVISRVRAATDLPVAAFHVSGEYAMLKAAAARGWLDERAALRETLLAIRRAGADIILTYGALEAAQASAQG